jgi:hypothetical protein
MDWETILAIITGVITVASLVTKLTPNKVDNVWAWKALRIVEIIALNNIPVGTKEQKK